MDKNIALSEDLSSEIEPDYEIWDEDDDQANSLPDLSPTTSDILPTANPEVGSSTSRESLDYHSDEPFLSRSAVGTVKAVQENLNTYDVPTDDPEEGKPIARIREPRAHAYSEPDGRDIPGSKGHVTELAEERSGLHRLTPEIAFRGGRKKSDIELEIEKNLADDPEFGDSLNELIRQKQVRRTLKPKRGKTQRSVRGSARSASSEGSRRGSRRDDDIIEIYRRESVPATKDDIKDNLKIQHDILSGIREQPWWMKRKLRTLRLAKSYVQKYEGHLSKGRGYQEAGAKFWRKFKRMMQNLAIVFIPWEMRIKKIESHFGSVVSSYFTFLRWLLGVNIILASITMGFIVVPEILVGKPRGSTSAKTVPPDELPTALNLMTIIDFEGYIKYSVFFYGFYGSDPVIGDGYRLPLAYFLAGLSTYALSFIIILRRMAYNSRLGRMASKDEQYIFSWRLFTNWDFMIGNTETAKNKAAEIATNLRELILEEQEKKRKENKSITKYCCHAN